MSIKVFLTPTISVDLHQEKPKMDKKVEELLTEQAHECVALYDKVLSDMAEYPAIVSVLVLERLLVRGAVELGMTKKDLTESFARVIEEEYSGVETGGLQ